MNCGRACNQLSAYIDRELTGAEMMQIRRHLGDCDGCRAEYESLCRMKMLLGRLPAPEPRPDFVAAALRRSEGQAAAPFAGNPWMAGGRLTLDRWRHWVAASFQPAFNRFQAPVGVTAALLASGLILSGVFLHRPRHSDALVATSPVSVLEGQDPVSHQVTWEYTSLESRAIPQQRPPIGSGRVPLNWVTASYPEGYYWNFP
jgi:anti-sigma factor RsiW